MGHEPPVRADDLTGPFLGTLALAEEAVSRRQLRSPLFIRLFRNVYLPAATPVTHELRCRAAMLVAPDTAVLTGHSAVSLYGVRLALPGDPVELLVPERGDPFRPHPGMNVRHVPVTFDEFEVVYGARVANPARMALDLLLNTRLRKTVGSAVAALDAVAHGGLVELPALRTALERRHDHGIVRARAAAALADARAESVPESLLRVLLVRSGIAVTPQVEVRWRGRFVARVDLAVDGYPLAVEYDGEWHADPEQARRDRERRTRLAQAGWRVIVVTKKELFERPEEVVRAVRTALSADIAASG